MLDYQEVMKPLCKGAVSRDSPFFLALVSPFNYPLTKLLTTKSAVDPA